jgi:isoquinoline 1-oxidoreductase subunit alpha
MSSIHVNGRLNRIDAEPDTPLLWILRDALGLTGTKFGCGAGLCGACTVHVDGQAVRSCQLTLADVGQAKVVTIEGLDPAAAHPIQKAWVHEQVPQCGYCQSGMIMASAALLNQTQKPTDADIDQLITNLCRCGTYPHVRAAIHRAAGSQAVRD